MARPIPNRKTSGPWDRLKPTKQDALDSMGFVSRGDTRLLEPKAQESYYNKIVARYMQFCTSHAKDLENAFASLSLDGEASASSDPASNPPTRKRPTAPIAPGTSRPLTPSPPKRTASSPTRPASNSSNIEPLPSHELSTILLALRKLREALLASSTTAISPIFSQRVHVFSIRLAILALHPPSYYPSLLHLLFVLHRPQHPLAASELAEMTTYLILDLACRQREFASAYALRARSRAFFAHGYNASSKNNNNSKSDTEGEPESEPEPPTPNPPRTHIVDTILQSVVTDNWVAFWRARRKVDGYMRAVMSWAIEPLRRTTLKAIGRSYLTCDVTWVLASATGGTMGWEELVGRERVGWIKEEDGERVVIRKIKVRGKETGTETGKEMGTMKAAGNSEVGEGEGKSEGKGKDKGNSNSSSKTTK